jgi:two-component system, NarL family, nitrate/nitrite response regulator NarL
LSNKGVLIVDHNKTFLESAIKFLTTDNHFAIVGWAVNAAEAFNKITLLNPDLVLIDFSLPDMNALDATKIIKLMPQPPMVIVLSINDYMEYCTQSMNAGANGFMSKSDFGNKIIPLVESLFCTV